MEIDLPQVGDRIELLYMPNDPFPIPVGTTGTVKKVNKGVYEKNYQVWVEWDIDRNLMLCMPPDEVRIITDAS